VLDLGLNKLVSLNDTLFANLKRLEVIILNNNMLLELSPIQFSGLTSLHEIDLASNNLTQLPNVLFANLAKLNRLILSKNKLTTLSNDIFQSLDSLAFLDLSYNLFSSLPDTIFDKTCSLVELCLSNNKFTDISPNLFAGLVKLRNLDLSFNQLTVLRYIFNDLRSLNYLSLKNNQIFAINTKPFGGVAVLSTFVLNVSGNPVARVTDTYGESYLKSICNNVCIILTV